MSPFYSFSYPLQLSEDDKKGIQYLYGPQPQAPLQIPLETNEIISSAVSPWTFKHWQNDTQCWLPQKKKTLYIITK